MATNNSNAEVVRARWSRVLAAAEQVEAQPASWPTPIDRVELAYKAFEIGVFELERENYMEALPHLEHAVDAGVEEARALMDLCVNVLSSVTPELDTESAHPHDEGDSAEEDQAEGSTPIYWQLLQEHKNRPTLTGRLLPSTAPSFSARLTPGLLLSPPCGTTVVEAAMPMASTRVAWEREQGMRALRELGSGFLLRVRFVDPFVDALPTPARSGHGRQSAVVVFVTHCAGSSAWSRRHLESTELSDAEPRCVEWGHGAVPALQPTTDRSSVDAAAAAAAQGVSGWGNEPALPAVLRLVHDSVHDLLVCALPDPPGILATALTTTGESQDEPAATDPADGAFSHRPVPSRHLPTEGSLAQGTRSSEDTHRSMFAQSMILGAGGGGLERLTGWNNIIVTCHTEPPEREDRANEERGADDQQRHPGIVSGAH